MSDQTQVNISRLEFVILMALLISMPALSIDAMLPALPAMGVDLLVVELGETQSVVTSIFIGMSIGQLLYGPLSDSVGRKPLMCLGMAIFVAGSTLCFLAENYQWLLIGRVLQGVGIGAPKTLCLAIIRDKYKGRDMARLMSNVMTLFILSPMIAPLLGQIILLFADWRMIFIVIAVFAMLSLLWFWLRIEESLPMASRRPYTIAALFAAGREVILNPVSLGYTLVMGLAQGAFIAYLSTASRVFQLQYHLQESFALLFAGLALCIGVATHMNSLMVQRYPMRNIVGCALLIMVTVTLLFVCFTLISNGHPALWALVVYWAITLSCVGLINSNLAALAMEPLGHIAGMGTTLVSTISTLMAVVIAIVVGSVMEQTVTPVIIAYLVCGSLSLLVVLKLRRITD
jgi:DHA1 family bicyclomycin/chloramphenicol resistance-like MFS transporter